MLSKSLLVGATAGGRTSTGNSNYPVSQTRGQSNDTLVMTQSASFNNSPAPQLTNSDEALETVVKTTGT